MECVRLVVKIPEGWGQGILVVKNGNSGWEGGFCPWEWGRGYGYLLELHNTIQDNKTLMTLTKEGF